MGTIITGFSVKRLKHFQIPLDTLKRLGGTSYIKINKEKDEVFVDLGLAEQSELEGFLNEDTSDTLLYVTNIYYGGISSGHNYDNFIKLLEQSIGELISIIVWEGGDSVIELKCIDGYVRETYIT